MRFELYSSGRVGCVTWRGPTDVVYDVENEREREFLEAYFAAQDAYLGGAVECPEMACSRRDASEQSFARAAYRLVAYDYSVKSADDHQWREGTERGSAA